DRAPDVLDVDDTPDAKKIEHRDEESAEHDEPQDVASSGCRWGIVVVDHGDRDSSSRPVHVGSHGVRTDDDSWDITESVGATALGVAAARAAETESDNPLISDPFARVFLDTAGAGEWDWNGAQDLPAEVNAAPPQLKPRM